MPQNHPDHETLQDGSDTGPKHNSLHGILNLLQQLPPHRSFERNESLRPGYHFWTVT
jgi:hypothetical protein